MGRDYYEVLGVAADASAADIRTAYRELSKRVHPDVGGNAALFGLIQEAYETLSDERQRTNYDRTRQFGARDARAGQEPGRPAPEPVYVFVRRRVRWGRRIVIGAAALFALGAVGDAIEQSADPETAAVDVSASPEARAAAADPTPIRSVALPSPSAATQTPEPVSLPAEPAVAAMPFGGFCGGAGTIAAAVQLCPGATDRRVTEARRTANGVWAVAQAEGTQTGGGGLFVLSYFEGLWEVVDYGPYLGCPPLGMFMDEARELGDEMFNCAE